jgi:hypothetical protein
MVARHDVRRVELKVAEMPDGLEDAPRARARRTIEQLGVNREAACLSERE